MSKSNIEKYFGIRISVNPESDPFQITRLKKLSIKIAELASFNPEEFFVYAHKLEIMPVRRNFFGSRFPLSARVNCVNVEYRVNEKQRKNGRIRFFNTYLHGDLTRQNPHLVPGVTTTEVKFSYPKDVFDGGRVFSNQLITYVSKKLQRHKHRKIKLVIEPIPSKPYELILKHGSGKSTHKDLVLDEDINFLLKQLSEEKQQEIDDRIERIRKTNPAFLDVVEPESNFILEQHQAKISDIKFHLKNNRFLHNLKLPDGQSAALIILDILELAQEGEYTDEATIRILDRIDEMVKSQKKGQLKKAYSRFIDVTGSYSSIFGTIYTIFGKFFVG